MAPFAQNVKKTSCDLKRLKNRPLIGQLGNSPGRFLKFDLAHAFTRV